MKNSRLIYITAVVIILGMLVCWFWRNKEVARPPVISTAKSASSISENPIPSSLSPANYPGGLPPMKNFVDPKVAKIEAIWAAQNVQSQDFYGKVIDQYGQPIVGATALGTLLWIQGVDVGEKREQHTTQTDQNGEFQLTGFHAARLAVAVTKEGYEMGRAAGVYQAPNKENKTGIAERAIFHMWKLKGAEPMVHTKFDSRVPYDGQTAAFDLFAGQKASSGDLQITLTRNPTQVRRGGDRFDWNVQIQVVGGGLVETSDLYPNEAPEGGYQPAFDFSVTKDAPGWTQRLTKTYYINTANGDYGRVNIDLTTDSERPQGTGITIEAWLNPVPGDKNLEFDPSQAIKP